MAEEIQAQTQEVHQGPEEKPKSVIVKSEVRKIAKGLGAKVSADFLEALDREVREIIRRAVERARGNKRVTLKPWDL